MDPAHSGAETSYRNTNWTAETAYHHRLRELNDDVAGEWSGPASAMTQATPNRPAVGTPAITATAQVGQILTVDTSGIADQDGLQNATFNYQWLAMMPKLPA